MYFYRIPVYKYPHNIDREKKSKERWLKTFDLLITWVYIECLILLMFINDLETDHIFIIINFLIAIYWIIEYYFGIKRKRPFLADIVISIFIIKVSASYSTIIEPIFDIINNFNFNLSNVILLIPLWHTYGILLTILYLAHCISFNMNDTQYTKKWPYL